MVSPVQPGYGAALPDLLPAMAGAAICALLVLAAKRNALSRAVEIATPDGLAGASHVRAAHGNRIGDGPADPPGLPSRALRDLPAPASSICGCGAAPQPNPKSCSVCAANGLMAASVDPRSPAGSMVFNGSVCRRERLYLDACSNALYEAAMLTGAHEVAGASTVREFMSINGILAYGDALRADGLAAHAKGIKVALASPLHRALLDSRKAEFSEAGSLLLLLSLTRFATVIECYA